MKKISTEFREALRGIRHLSALITYQSEDSTYLLTTENDDNLITESGDFLGTEKGPVILESTSINSVNPIFEVELFKTFCKSIQIDSKMEIPQKTTINVKIGVLIEEEYEYLDFGNYLVNEVTYQADKDSYLITAYDRMIESMIDYDLDVKYPISIKGLIIEICNKFAWKYDLGNFVNQNKIIEKNVFDEQELTYRDVLDQISQVTASSIGFDNETLKIKYISEPENSTLLPFTIPQVINVKTYSEKLTIDERDLKDSDIDIHEKYGPVNSLLITNNNDIVINNLINQNSIDKNGKSEFQIDNNLILLNDSENYIHEIFEYIDGLEYYLYDVDTFGVLFLDPLDTFYIKIGEMIYPTLMLNDDIKLTTGLVETIFAKKPEISTTEYTATDKNEKKINNALISINKANGQLVLKATSDGKLVQAELNADADNGSEFNVKADNINFESYNFNLTSDNIVINSRNWNIESNGNMHSKALKVFNLTESDINTMRQIVLKQIATTDDYLDKYDINGNGVVDLNDMVNARKIVNGTLSNTRTTEYLLNTQDTNAVLTIKDNINNSTGCSLGSGGAWFNSLGTQSIYIEHRDSGTDFVSLTNSSLQLNSGNSTDFTSITSHAVSSPTITQTSLSTSKKHFEKIEDVLNIIENTDIYKYNLLSEEEGTKKHYGLVIGNEFNYSEELTSKNNDGVDLYSMISVCFQAIKQLNNKVKTLEEEIEELKNENNKQI